MGSRRRSTSETESGLPNDGGSGDAGSSVGKSDSESNQGSQPGRSESRSRRDRHRRLLIEQLGHRRVLAVITGTVFNDADLSLRPEPGEVRLADRLAFLDINENGTLDSDEPFSVTDENGQFQFEDLEEGIYPVRLFDGSTTQEQTFPVGANAETWQQAPVDVIGISRSPSAVHMLTPSSLVISEISGTRSTVHQLDFEPTDIVAADVTSMLVAQGQIPEGAVPPTTLITGTRFIEFAEYSGFWLVPGNEGSTAELIQGANVSAAAVGADARGVLLSPYEGANNVHSLSFHGEQVGEDWSIRSVLAATSVTVPLDTQILSSGSLDDATTASRTVMAWQVEIAQENSDDGSGGEGESPEVTSSALGISLWSNQTASFIDAAPVPIENATELVSFDDASGLLAVRYDDGGLGVLDANAGFAPLYEFPDASGPATILADGKTLASITESGGSSALTLFDLNNGNAVVSEALTLSGVGGAKHIVAGDSLQSSFVLGRSGVARVALDVPKAHTLEVKGDGQQYHIDFGLEVTGENQPPVIGGEFRAKGLEDNDVELTPEEIASLVSDADQDRLFSLLVEDPQYGSVTFDYDGSWKYTPEPDFYGADYFGIQFSDGQSTSEVLRVAVELEGTPDAPTGIVFRGEGIPEHTLPEYTVGSVEVSDPDGESDLNLSVSDERFEIRNGSLLFVSGSLDHETEPEIFLTIHTVDQPAGGFLAQDIIIFVIDQNDPILDIHAEDGTVLENAAGQFVGYVSSEQHDSFDQQPVSYSVDDDRFEVIGEELRLKADSMLDFEAEPVVVLNVTADDGSGSTMSTEVRVTVMDLPEELGVIRLSDETVMEWEPGAVVGDVFVEGGTIGSNWEFAVDDGRFEIAETTLKLIDDIWLQRSAAEEIQIEITATDNSGNFGSVSQQFVIEVLENGSPFHNDDDPYDVDGNDVVTPLDALAIINYLNIYGPGPVGPGDPGYGYDVNGDGEVTAIDALLVINWLNSQNGGGGNVGGPLGTPGAGDAEGVGEGEHIEPSDVGGGNEPRGGSSLIGPVNDAPQIGPQQRSEIRSQSQSQSQSQPRNAAIESQSWDPSSNSTDGAADWLKGVREDNDEDPALERAIDELILLLRSGQG